MRSLCRKQDAQYNLARDKNISTTLPSCIHIIDIAHMNVVSLTGAKYFVSFTDEMISHTSVGPMKSKNEASSELIICMAWVERQSRSTVTVVRMYGASSTDYSKHLYRLCQIHRNAKKGNQHKYKRAICYGQKRSSRKSEVPDAQWSKGHLLQSLMPNEFWAHLYLTAVDARNCITNVNKSKPSLELLTGIKLNISHYRVFGYDVYNHVAEWSVRSWKIKWRKIASYGLFRIVWLETESRIARTL